MPGCLHAFNNISYNLSPIIEHSSIIRTLFSIVFPSIKTIESFSIDSTTKRNEIYPKGAEFWAPDSLSIFQFGMNAGYAEKYQRSYPKFQTFLANFGGIFNVLIKIGECVAYIASNHLMYSSVLCTLNNIKIKKKSINLNTSDAAIDNKNDKNIMTTSQYNSITNILQKQPDIKLLTRGHTVKEKIIKVNSTEKIQKSFVYSTCRKKLQREIKY